MRWESMTSNESIQSISTRQMSMEFLFRVCTESSDIRGSIILVYLPKTTALIKPTKLTESTKLEEVMCENRIDFRKILIEEIK